MFVVTVFLKWAFLTVFLDTIFFVSDLQKGRSFCYANFQTDLKETEKENAMEEKTEEKETKIENRRKRN
jgi:hypothetical protein